MDAFPVICLIMPFLVALGGEPQVPRKELTLPGVLSRVEAAYPKVKGIAQERQAAFTEGRLWPTFTFHRPPTPSSMRWPSISVM